MKKRICALLCLAFCAVVFGLPVMASEGDLLVPEYSRQYIYGDDFMLTDDESALLDEQAGGIYISTGTAVMVARDDAMDVDITVYADSIASAAGVSDAIVLVLNSQQWYIGRFGSAADVIDDDAVQSMWSSFTSGSSDYECISAFLDAAAQRLGLTVNPVIPDERLLPRLVDSADLLSSSEERRLLAVLDEISERQQFDVAVVTVETIGGQYIMDYADDFYDYNGYGFGEDADGVLLLVDMGTRECWITTTGYGMVAIDDYCVEYILDEFVPYLSDADYETAFTTFADLCDEFVTQARTGEPYTRGNLPRRPVSAMWIPGSMLIGAVPSLGITGRMKSKLKTVRTKTRADSYTDAAGSGITARSDVFLYRNVTRSARVQASDFRSGSGGGHFSSSGRSHGGGGRGF